MFLAPWKPKSTVLTMFFSPDSKNHGIYWGFRPGPSKNTGIYAGFSVLQDVVSMYGQHKNTVFYEVFASRPQKKRVQKGHRWPILSWTAKKNDHKNPQHQSAGNLVNCFYNVFQKYNVALGSELCHGRCSSCLPAPKAPWHAAAFAQLARP